MFKNKRIYALLAVAGIISGSAGVFSQNAYPETAQQTSSSFIDVPEDKWYYPYVSYLSEKGIVNGMTETEYMPEGSFTIAESAAVITRYLGLESEAAKRKNAMLTLGINGSELWYAGYVQLMHEAGIIDVEAYGCTLNGGSVSIDNPSMWQAPIKRYEFASFVVRSFELGATNIRTASGTDGSEFIHNGYYDENVLINYAPLIGDYWYIPQGYEFYVLKAYYNGIFNGDDLGNFNPHKNLTRAEMAKVITVIIDKSQRVFAEAATPVDPEQTGYELASDSYIEYKGVKYLNPAVSDSILLGEIVSCLSMNQGLPASISYTPSNYYPNGYSITLHHYRPITYGFTDELEVVYENNVYSSDFRINDVLLFVLNDLSTGEAVDAYEIKLSASGLTENSNCNYLS